MSGATAFLDNRTCFHDDEGIWYRLDNAGIIMPSVSNAIITNIFRLSATLVEDVDPEVLARALASVAARFPYYVVELRKGFFWHYLVPHREGLRLETEPRYPTLGYDVNAKGHCLVRVFSSGRSIACEFHHSIADGTGGIRFLKNLIVRYLVLRGRLSGADSLSGDRDLYDLDKAPADCECEDAYHRYYNGGYPAPALPRRAWLPKAAPLPGFAYRVTCGTVPLAAALQKAKEYGVSLTDLLSAAYIEALQELWLASPPRERRRKRIAILIAVNMRRLYPSETNRNFSLFALLSQHMELGRRDFEDILMRAHHQLRYELDSKSMGAQLSRNVNAAESALFRLIPLPLKALAFRLLFSVFGDSLNTGALSNLGSVELPAAAAAFVERFDFLLSPTKGKTNVAIVSWKGSLRIDFGTLSSSSEIERLFFTRLRRLGLPVKIETNL